MNKIRKTLKQALLAAGKILSQGLHQEKTIEFKNGRDNLVTQIDKAAEKQIITVIRRSFPSHLILAEESDSSPALKKPGKPGTCKWIIDPLDGTTNFAHTLPIACVSIAFEQDGKVVLGGVLQPFTREFFWAEKDSGSYLNDQKIRVSKAAWLVESLMVTGFPYDRKERMEYYLKFFSAFMLRTQEVRRLGSAALDLCYTACGRFDGYWEFNLNAWDTAAGSLILQEAGGRITTASGRPFDIYGPTLVASNGRIHAEMLKVLEATEASLSGKLSFPSQGH